MKWQYSIVAKNVVIYFYVAHAVEVDAQQEICVEIISSSSSSIASIGTASFKQESERSIGHNDTELQQVVVSETTPLLKKNVQSQKMKSQKKKSQKSKGQRGMSELPLLFTPVH